MNLINAELIRISAYDFNFNFSAVEKSLCKVQYRRGGRIGDVGFSGFCRAQGREHRIDGLVDGQQESRHLRDRQRQRTAVSDLIVEEGNHGAA